MAADLGTLTARLKLNTADAEASVGRFGKTLLGLAGIAAGLEGLKTIITDATTAFGEQQTAAVLLNQALKDAGQKWTPALGAALTVTEGSMLKLGDTSADTQNAIAKLVTAGVPAADALKRLGTIADLAAKLHLSLADATTLVINGTQGMGRGFKQLGIILPPAVGTAKTLASATAALAKAQETYTADLHKHGETAAQITAAHDKLTQATQKLHDVTASMKDPMANFDGLIGSINSKTGGTAAALGTTLPGSLSTLGATLNDKVMVPLGGLVNQAMPSVIKALDTFANWFTAVGLPTLTAWAAWLATNVVAPAVNITKTIVPPLIKIFQGIYDQLNNWKALGPIVGGIVTAFLGFKLLSLASTVAAPLSVVSDIFAGWKAGGLAGVGAALTEALGPIGVAATALGLIVAAWEWLAAHEQKAPQVPPGFKTAPGDPRSVIPGAIPNFGRTTSHALGGDIIPGLRYRVGERGAEDFVSSVPGQIIPNNKIGGMGHTINVYVTNASATAQDIANQVSWALKTAAV